MTFAGLQDRYSEFDKVNEYRITYFCFLHCLISSLILQPWRSATICPFGGLDLFPSIEALVKNGKNRSLQAIELESGIGHQWRLWKWASYCASEVNITTILSDGSLTTLILVPDMLNT